MSNNTMTAALPPAGAVTPAPPPLTPFAQRVRSYLKAAQPGISITTTSQFDTDLEITAACSQLRGCALYRWNCVDGVTWLHTDPNGHEELVSSANANHERHGVDPATTISPQAAVAFFSAIRPPPGTPRAVLVMYNAHRFISDPRGQTAMTPLMQQLLLLLEGWDTHKQQLQQKGTDCSKHVILVTADTLELPVELRPMFWALEHTLPNETETWDLIRAATDSGADLPEQTSEDGQALINAALGMTRLDILGACGLSLASPAKKIVPEVLWDVKVANFKKGGLLTLHQGDGGFDQLGGLNAIKDFLRRLLRHGGNHALAKPRGIVLIGPSGTGKSRLCQTLGYELGVRTAILDFGSLMGSLVGQTEANVRLALAQVDAMAPARQEHNQIGLILMLDEVEKALAGTGGGEHDSGVGARLLGTFLTWLNDRTSNVFVVVTSNDISRLPPELTRAERFDGIFFMDLPVAEQRRQIWDIYVKHFQLRADQIAMYPSDADWTGAEIRACCRLACLMDVSLVEAAQQVVPVAVTSREKIEALRKMADKRYLSADYPGLYQASGQPVTSVAGATRTLRRRGTPAVVKE